MVRKCLRLFTRIHPESYVCYTRPLLLGGIKPLAHENQANYRSTAEVLKVTKEPLR